MGSMSAICPYRWTGTTAVTGRPLRRLISLPASSTVHCFFRYSLSFAGSMLYVCSSMSTNSGNAPACEIASVVAMKVCGTVTTTSPGFTPLAMRAKRRASVPLLIATE